MKSVFFAFFTFSLYFISVCTGQDRNYFSENDLSGVISESFSSASLKFWYIKVPDNMYVRLDIKEVKLLIYGTCSQEYLKIHVAATNETYTYCYQDSNYPKTIRALSDVTIAFSHYWSSGKYVTSPYGTSSFSLSYHKEDVICAMVGHFRCSKHKCIDGRKKCDGVTDCENGSDEIGCGGIVTKDVDASRNSTRTWLLKNRQSAGWGRNTHRAITALYLSQRNSFRGQNLEAELMVKELELQTSLALMRNSTDPLSVNELSMFVNALSVVCHDPRRFYGYDLVKVLSERVSVAKSPSPAAYLTLCNSNWTLTHSDIRSLLQLLHKHSTYPFSLDIQAVTVMALTCVKNQQEKEFTSIHNATNIYNATVEKFAAGQLPDGSFGNVYTTALVTQALFASKQKKNPKWNVNSTIQYLIKQLDSPSVDFLSAYLALPILSGRSLVDLAAVNCTNISRKQDEDKEISDVTNKLGEKIRVQYSLYIGDQKDVIHTIYLRLPEQSSAYDIMRVAQVVDPKYKFRYRDVSGQMYVYEIAGIINDPEAGKFWLMYSESNSTVEHNTGSPEKFIMDDGEHLIMWYKTAHIYNKKELHGKLNRIGKCVKFSV